MPQTHAQRQRTYRQRQAMRDVVRDVVRDELTGIIMKLNDLIDRYRDALVTLSPPPDGPPLGSPLHPLPKPPLNPPEVLPFPRRKAERGSRLSPDWAPTDEEKAYAFDKGVKDVSLTAERFRNFWMAKSGKDATKRDWSATWRNWCISEAERKGTLTNGHDASVSIEISPSRAEIEATKRRLENLLQ